MISELTNFTSKTGIEIDIVKLQESIELFTKNLFLNHSETFEEWFKNNKIPCINLNHPASLNGKGRLRWFRYSGDYYQLANDNIKESDFIIFAKELEKTYIFECVNKIKEYHLKTFKSDMIGRMQLIWIKPEYCYKIHSDSHVMHRYHIPIETNKNCVWCFRDDNVEETLLHMPADGNIWWLNPNKNEHTVINYGSTPRLHLLMSSVI